jgi:endothelin-converting enzyme/putative endopeptidase
MTRTQALTMAFPFAIVLAAAGVDVRAQAQQQPPASQSGIDVAAMDRTANPCTDFYQFACGGWIKAHPAPPDQPYYTRFHELQDRNNAILREILEQAGKPGAPADQQKIGDYYASCMAETEIDAKGTAPLGPDLNRVDAIKDKLDIPAVAGFLQTVGTTAFFGFGSAPDFKDATQYMLIYAQGGLGLPDRDYYVKDDENSKTIRLGYEKHVSKMLQLAGSAPAQADADAKAVLAIETALARSALDRTARRNPANIYHKMSRDEVKNRRSSNARKPRPATAPTCRSRSS